MKIFNKIPETKPKTPLLDKVSVPSDIRSFSVSELEILSDELREFLLFWIISSSARKMIEPIPERPGLTPRIFFFASSL